MVAMVVVVVQNRKRHESVAKETRGYAGLINIQIVLSLYYNIHWWLVVIVEGKAACY